MNPLNNIELIELYNYDRKKSTLFGGTCYVFSNRKTNGDIFEITYIPDEKTWYFLIDNFPFPRKYFQHNLPYFTKEQFELDLIRMKIEIPIRKKP